MQARSRELAVLFRQISPSFPAPPLPLPWEGALDHLKGLVTVTQPQISVQAQKLKKKKKKTHRAADPTSQSFSKPQGSGWSS